VLQDCLLLVFFHESVFPQPQKIPLGPIQILSNIRRDIRKSMCTPGINDTGGKFATPVSTTSAANFATSFASVVDTDGK
jgi:hypothetical protein